MFRSFAQLCDKSSAKLSFDASSAWASSPPGAGAKFLLTGLLTCGVCGGSMEALSRSHGRRRVHFYGCSAHRRRGARVCGNGLIVPLVNAENAILASVERTLLEPALLEAAIAEASARLSARGRSDAGAALRREVQTVEGKLERLVQVAAAGASPVAALVAEIQACERRRRELHEQMAQTAVRPTLAFPSAAVVSRRLRSLLNDWRELLCGNLADAQRAIRTLIVGRLTLKPEGEDVGYRFMGKGTVAPVLAGVIAQNVASLMPASWNQIVGWLSQIDAIRQAA